MPRPAAGRDRAFGHPDELDNLEAAAAALVASAARATADTRGPDHATLPSLAARQGDLDVCRLSGVS
ncbi:MAG: hypothetical protein ACRDQ2_04590 [Gaiellales bacterium]